MDRFFLQATQPCAGKTHRGWRVCLRRGVGHCQAQGGRPPLGVVRPELWAQSPARLGTGTGPQLSMLSPALGPAVLVRPLSKRPPNSSPTPPRPQHPSRLLPLRVSLVTVPRRTLPTATFGCADGARLTCKVAERDPLSAAGEGKRSPGRGLGSSALPGCFVSCRRSWMVLARVPLQVTRRQDLSASHLFGR